MDYNLHCEGLDDDSSPSSSDTVTVVSDTDSDTDSVTDSIFTKVSESDSEEKEVSNIERNLNNEEKQYNATLQELRNARSVAEEFELADRLNQIYERIRDWIEKY